MRLSHGQAEKLGIVPGPRRRNYRRPEPQAPLPNFLVSCAVYGIPRPQAEYAFAQNPLTGAWWRFDWLFPSKEGMEGWLAVEKIGGVWVHGHHSRGKDQIEDMMRRNEAGILGYTILEFPPEMFETKEAFVTIRRALDAYEEMP